MNPRAVAASLALAVTRLSAQDEPATIKGADVELVRSVRVVGERVAAIVGANRAPAVVAFRAEEPTRVGESTKRARRVLPPAYAGARARAWQDLGFGAGSEPWDLIAAVELDLSGMSLDAELARLLVDPGRLLADAGNADPNVDPSASVLLATGVTPDEAVAGHYIAHALLDAARVDGPMTTDVFLARSALAEGSANLAALVFLFGGLGIESEILSGALRPEDPLDGRLVPVGLQSANPVLRSMLEFVYLDGFAQVSALAKKGGFGRLAQERKVRSTTRDVLHLDRPPAQPQAPPAVPSLPPTLGLTVSDRDTLGEQGIISLVSVLTGKDNLGLIAGDGWAGDSLWRFEGGGSGATVWVTRWLSDEDAKDFAYAIERTLSARFPSESLQEDTLRGGRLLRRQDRAYRIQKTGLEVVVTVAPLSIDDKLGPAENKKVQTAPAKSPKRLK